MVPFDLHVQGDGRERDETGGGREGEERGQMSKNHATQTGHMGLYLVIPTAEIVIPCVDHRHPLYIVQDLTYLIHDILTKEEGRGCETTTIVNEVSRPVT